MKKIFYLVCFTALFSCKKNAEITSSKSAIRDVVLNMKSSADLSSLSKPEIKSLIDYLNTCNEQDRKLIFSKMKDLQSAESTRKVNNSADKAKTTSLTEDDPGLEELMAVEVLSTGDPDPDAATEPAQPTFVMSSTSFSYKWTVARNSFGFFRIESRERFEINDYGALNPVISRYRICYLVHNSSYIVGYAPGISWTETENNNYYDLQPPGGYFAYVGTEGNLEALGYHSPCSSGQYINAGVAYESNGSQRQ